MMINVHHRRMNILTVSRLQNLFNNSVSSDGETEKHAIGYIDVQEQVLIPLHILVCFASTSKVDVHANTLLLNFY